MSRVQRTALIAFAIALPASALGFYLTLASLKGGETYRIVAAVVMWPMYALMWLDFRFLGQVVMRCCSQTGLYFISLGVSFIGYFGLVWLWQRLRRRKVTHPD